MAVSAEDRRHLLSRWAIFVGSDPRHSPQSCAGQLVERPVEPCFQADIATGVRHTDRAGRLISSTHWLVTSIVYLTLTGLLLITSTLSIRLVTSALHTAVFLTPQAITTLRQAG